MIIWYVARGAGLVALVLLTATTVLGVSTRSGRRVARLPRFAVRDVHRNVSLLAVVFLTVHVATLLADPDAELRLVDLVVPFTSSDSTVATALGAIALDLLLAVMITGMLRRRIGHRTWRAVHWAAYALWPVAAAHGVLDGTDSGRTWFLAVWSGCVFAVLAAVLWRLVPRFQERQSRRITSVRPVHDGSLLDVPTPSGVSASVSTGGRVR